MVNNPICSHKTKISLVKKFFYQMDMWAINLLLSFH